MKVGIVVPHIFMQDRLRGKVIFSPGDVALVLANGLQALGAEVTLFSPGPVTTTARNITADLSYFEQELAGRGDDYTDLLKKHPFTFITLARQVQSELIAKAYAQLQAGELDIVHMYTNEEDTALPFAQLVKAPIVFTHHDPFNFLVKYKNNFPKYAHLNWLSMSYAQRSGMPSDTNWVGNIYHGFSDTTLQPIAQPSNDYVAYLGRIIEPKGVHLAIAAIKTYNQTHSKQPLKLLIAGKHYAGHSKDTYWQEQILPQIDGEVIQYIGHIKTPEAKQQLLANARGLLVPSLFDEPFGMVGIEALACGTPLIGLDSGALPEVIEHGKTGFIVPKRYTADTLDTAATEQHIAQAIEKLPRINRHACRQAYETRFTAERMCQEHLATYQSLVNQ